MNILALKERLAHQKSLSKNLQGNPTTFFVGTIDNLLKNTFKWGQTSTADRTRGIYDEMSHFISPSDVQAIKAAGVTYVNSMLERVIEEQAKGDPTKAELLRKSLSSEIGQQLSTIKPASPESKKLKEQLVKRGLWSQYLEVGTTVIYIFSSHRIGR